MAILPDYGPVRAETCTSFLKYQNITYVQFVGLTFWCRNYCFLILAHPVYKMRIIQEPNMLEL